jgi:DNA-binding CsgD family transcriptional regulator
MPAVRGDFATAQREARDAARLHAELGNVAYEATALYLSAIFGAAPAVSGRLDALSSAHAAPLRRGYADHAAGLATRDAKRLDQAAADLALLGAPLLAAIAATDAALCHAEHGDTAKAIASGERARTYAERGDGYVALPRPGNPTVPALTNREREVAQLTMAGLPNAQIAARMVLSVRTIETHLGHVYTKLECSSRTELATLLATPPESNR